MLEVADADLKLGPALSGRTVRQHAGNRSTSLVDADDRRPGFAISRRSRRALPNAPSSTVPGGPRVRIPFAPAASLSLR